MALKVFSLVLCAALAVTYALPTQDEARSNTVQTEDDLLDNIYTSDCALRKDSVTCLKQKIYSFVDKTLGQKDTITVTDGVQIVKTGSDKDGAPRSINSDDSIESLILNRFSGFLESHTLKVDIKGSEIVNAVSSAARSFGDISESFEDENAIDEGRAKKKKINKLLGPLMGAVALKAAVLGKLALWAIALLAGKALLIGKIALVLSSIIGIKKLMGSQQGGKHVTYEVVAHPQQSTSHVSSHESVYGGSGGGYGGDVGGGASYASGSSSGHGGWGRSLDAQTLAYRAHAQNAQ